MTSNLLASILKNMYSNTKTDKVAMIHLFGIKYAKEIRDNNININEILKTAEMPVSYHTEISKGIKLAKYVDLKNEYKY